MQISSAPCKGKKGNLLLGPGPSYAETRRHGAFGLRFNSLNNKNVIKELHSRLVGCNNVLYFAERFRKLDMG